MGQGEQEQRLVVFCRSVGYGRLHDEKYKADYRACKSNAIVLTRSTNR